jgi:hypothetical protein
MLFISKNNCLPRENLILHIYFGNNINNMALSAPLVKSRMLNRYFDVFNQTVWINQLETKVLEFVSDF